MQQFQLQPKRYYPRGGVAGPMVQNGRPEEQYIEDFFVNEVDTPAAGVAFGATFTGNIAVQSDSDFKLVKLTYFADIALAAQTDSTRIVPLCSIQIIDLGSGRQLFSAPAPIPSIFGAGQLPFILPVPRIFQASTSISIIVANFSAATTYNIRLSFIGTKIFTVKK